MTEKRPNILFFLPDQHRADWLGFNPDLPVRTPNLDRLASSGLNFTRAYCTSPLCAPSRASLASGKDYDSCGVVNNGQNYPLNQPTYYRALRDAGYRVAGVGKFDLHKPELDWNLDGSRLLDEWGFTEGIDNEGKLDGTVSYRRNNGKPRGPYMKFLSEKGLAESYVAEHDKRRRAKLADAYITDLPDNAYCDNWVSENGLRFLKNFPSHQPWHLVVNFTGPHNPMEVTRSMRERWSDVPMPPACNNENADPEALLRSRQNYAAMIENIDRQTGRFIDAVRERGELDRTLIVYSSDHGEMLGDHGLWGKGTWRDSACRVPLIIAGPGVKNGAVSKTIVGLHDLAPTFIEAAGAEPMPHMDARSLWNVLRGQSESNRKAIVCGLNEWRIACDGRYKLVETPSEKLFFDLEKDPDEISPLSVESPDRVVDPFKTLERIIREAGSP